MSAVEWRLRLDEPRHKSFGMPVRMTVEFSAGRPALAIRREYEEKPTLFLEVTEPNDLRQMADALDALA